MVFESIFGKDEVTGEMVLPSIWDMPDEQIAKWAWDTQPHPTDPNKEIFKIGNISIERPKRPPNSRVVKKVSPEPTNIRYKLAWLKDVLLGNNLFLFGPTGTGQFE